MNLQNVYICLHFQTDAQYYMKICPVPPPPVIYKEEETHLDLWLASRLKAMIKQTFKFVYCCNSSLLSVLWNTTNTKPSSKASTTKLEVHKAEEEEQGPGGQITDIG